MRLSEWVLRIVAALLLGMLILVLVVGLSSCAGRYDWAALEPEAPPEAVAMIEAAGMSAAAKSTSTDIPPLLVLASWLHEYGVTGILPPGGTLAIMSWCQGDGAEPAGYEPRIHHRQPSRQDEWTPWDEIQTVLVYIPPASEVDSTWVDVRAYDANGRLTDWCTPSCIYTDTLCTTTLDCGPPE